MNANPNRELISQVDGIDYLRIPIETHFVEINENLESILERYAKPVMQEGDSISVSCKIVSICLPHLHIHKDQVRPGLLAKLIVKFVKKWPNDIGYSNPRKMQVAINRAGYFRILLALKIGALLKLIGKPGWFYRIAGNQINAIDGFTVGYTSKPIFENYAFLPPRPQEAVDIANKFEMLLGVPVAIMDGNNIENNVISMSDSLSKKFSEKKWKEIMKGNPQGQEDDGRNTPIVVVREKGG